MVEHKTALGIPILTPQDQLRFWGKVDFSDLDGCWLWTGAATGRGYGSFHAQRRRLAVHRVAYAIMRGPVPSGRVIDHNGSDGMGCVSQLCVRFDHLEAVGQDLNVARQYLRGERLSWLTPEEAAHYDSMTDEEILAEAMSG